MSDTDPISEQYVQRALADLLRGEAAIRGLSAPMLVELTGLKVQTVRRILKGDREVGLFEFIKICAAFNLEYPELVDRAYARAREKEQADIAKAANIDRKLRSNF